MSTHILTAEYMQQLIQRYDSAIQAAAATGLHPNSVGRAAVKYGLQFRHLQAQGRTGNTRKSVGINCAKADRCAVPRCLKRRFSDREELCITHACQRNQGTLPVQPDPSVHMAQVAAHSALARQRLKDAEWRRTHGKKGETT